MLVSMCDWGINMTNLSAHFLYIYFAAARTVFLADFLGEARDAP